MKYIYEPFILRRLAGGRIFIVNPQMSYEAFVDCFHIEHPYFLTFVLDDGRVATIPNPTVMPLHLLSNGYWPRDLFPTNWEYVTFKNGNYPIIATANPVTKQDEWFKKFEKLVTAYCKETLAEFVTTGGEFLPLEVEKFERVKLEKIPTHAL